MVEVNNMRQTEVKINIFITKTQDFHLLHITEKPGFQHLGNLSREINNSGPALEDFLK
jgi:hypothetical protein